MSAAFAAVGLHLNPPLPDIAPKNNIDLWSISWCSLCSFLLVAFVVKKPNHKGHKVFSQRTLSFLCFFCRLK